MKTERDFKSIVVDFVNQEKPIWFDRFYMMCKEAQDRELQKA